MLLNCILAVTPRAGISCIPNHIDPCPLTDNLCIYSFKDEVDINPYLMLGMDGLGECLFKKEPTRGGIVLDDTIMRKINENARTNLLQILPTKTPHFSARRERWYL